MDVTKIKGLMATAQKTLATWLKKHKECFACTLGIELKPSGNGGAIHIAFTCTKGTLLTEDDKKKIRGYMLGDFQEAIESSVRQLGWKSFRVVACARQLADKQYCWTVERRDASRVLQGRTRGTRLGPLST